MLMILPITSLIMWYLWRGEFFHGIVAIKSNLHYDLVTLITVIILSLLLVVFFITLFFAFNLSRISRPTIKVCSIIFLLTLYFILFKFSDKYGIGEDIFFFNPLTFIAIPVFIFCEVLLITLFLKAIISKRVIRLK